MTAREMLKYIFALEDKEILEIEQILYGYKCYLNKSKNSNVFYKKIFEKGFKSTSEFFKKYKYTKDMMPDENSKLKTIIRFADTLKLDKKEILEMCNYIISKEELGRDKECSK